MQVVDDGDVPKNHVDLLLGKNLLVRAYPRRKWFVPLADHDVQ